MVGVLFAAVGEAAPTAVMHAAAFARFSVA
jgi:hypothetical protein